MWSSLSIVLLFSLVCVSDAQELSVEPFIFGRRTAEIGYVTDIAQDSRGFIWIATREGLFRFGGARLEAFHNNPLAPDSLIENDVEHLSGTSPDSFWVITRSGILHRFLPANDGFQRYSLSLNEDPSRAISLRLDAVHVDSTGTLWVSPTGQGLFRYDEERDDFVPFSTGSLRESVVFIGEGGPRRLSLSIKGRGIRFLTRSSGGWQAEEELIPIAQGADHKTFRHQNAIWILTRGGGLYRLSDGERTAQKIPLVLAKDTLEDDRSRFLTSVCAFQDGSLLIGTDGAGLLSHDQSGQRLLRIVTTSSGDPMPGRITALLQDSSNTIWIGTTEGLYTHNPYRQPFARAARVLPVVEGDAPIVTAAAHLNGVTIIGTAARGLWIYRKDGADPQPLPIPALRDAVVSITALQFLTDGSLLIGTAESGLLRVDPSDGRLLQREATGFISTLAPAPDGEGILFAERERGIGIFKPSGDGLWTINRSHSWSAAELERLAITSIAPMDATSLAVATDGSGLFLLHGGEGGLKVVGIDNENVRGLFSNKIRQVRYDGKALWAATAAGLSRVLLDGASVQTWLEQDGLPGNDVRQIALLPDGEVWVATSRGIASLEMGDGLFRSFGTEDGIPFSIFFPAAGGLVADGTVIFGAEGGVLKFVPSELPLNPLAPTPLITDIELRGGSPLIRYQSGLPQSVTLGHDHLTFTIRFGATDFSDPFRNTYRYMLQPLESQWSRPSPESSITLSRLPPGEYEFLLSTANKDGVWSDAPAALTILVNLPLWDTFWFRLSTGSALIIGLFFAYRVRTNTLRKRQAILEFDVRRWKRAEERLLRNQRRLRELARSITLAEEKERRRISIALHDSIGHALSLAQIRLSQALKKGDAKALKEAVSDTIGNISGTIEATRTLTVDISPPALYTFGFIAAAENLLERMGDQHGLMTTFLAQEEPLNLTEEKAVLLYQILNELLVNIVKHARAASVTVSVFNHDETVTLKVRDDGIGFNVPGVAQAGSESVGFGLFSIGERLESLGGALRINTRPEHGTEIVVHLHGALEGQNE